MKSLQNIKPVSYNITIIMEQKHINHKIMICGY